MQFTSSCITMVNSFVQLWCGMCFLLLSLYSVAIYCIVFAVTGTIVNGLSADYQQIRFIYVSYMCHIYEAVTGFYTFTH